MRLNFDSEFMNSGTNYLNLALFFTIKIAAFMYRSGVFMSKSARFMKGVYTVPPAIKKLLKFSLASAEIENN
jgi:uncharacterized transporter YbjL